MMSTMIPSWASSWASSISSRQSLAYTFLALVVVKVLVRRKTWKRTPPGPPKLPLIGNLHNMPDGMDWVKYLEISKQCQSEIISMGALGVSIVVLNSYETALDLLDQRSGIYSSRPRSIMFNELAGLDGLFSLVPYGDLWRASRRMFTQHFGFGNTKLNQPREIFYSRRFLGQLLEKPDDFRNHIRNLVGSIAVSMTYGIKAQAVDDPYIEAAEETTTLLSEKTVGTYMVDIIPPLRYLPSWLPGLQFHNVAAECRKRLYSARDLLFDATITAMTTGNCTPCFVSEALEDLRSSAYSEEDLVLLKNTANQVYLAGADTIVSALSTVFLDMVCYPEVQTKLQAELDSVLGGRLPEHEDLESMPYLDAVCMESLRIQSPLPFGVPHLVTMEDVYKGYYIPKDSIVIANIWAMHMDPRDYPDPETYNPERFLKNGVIDESVRNPLDMTFGFGRRICPGRHLAVSTLKMTIAAVLSNFNLTKKIDANGRPIEPKREYTFSFITHPKDYVCEIKPRSRQAEKTISLWTASEGSNPP